MRKGKLVTWRRCLPCLPTIRAQHSIKWYRSHWHAGTSSFIHSLILHTSPIYRCIHSTTQSFSFIRSSSFSFLHIPLHSFAQQHADTWWVAILPCDDSPPWLCLVICISMCPNFGFCNLHLLLVGVLVFSARIKCEYFLTPLPFFRTVHFLTVTAFCSKGVAKYAEIYRISNINL